MTKIILVTHGPLAESFKEAARMFFGDKCDELNAVGLFPGQSPEDLQKKLQDIIDENKQEDYLFLVDMFGGTPFNVVCLLIDANKDLNIQGLAGVNMPILMEVLSNCDTQSSKELIENINNISTDTISDIRQKLNI